MVQNAVQNAAKRKTKRINMHCNGINKTFKNHERHGKKGKMVVKKWGFRGKKLVIGYK